MHGFIYQESLRTFNQDLFDGVLTQKLINALKDSHVGVPQSQKNTFDESLSKLGLIFGPSYLDQEIMCCIEYRIRSSGGCRIDFMLSGYDEYNNKNVIVIELKRWSRENVNLIPGSQNVNAFVAREEGYKETVHPSFQSFNYCDMMQLFYKEVNDNNINLHPCSYLHNYIEKEPPVLLDDRFINILELSPMFTKTDNSKLVEFIKKYIKKPDNSEIFEILDNSKICPTTKLQNNVKKIFLDNDNFKLFNNQQIAYNAIMGAIKESIATNKKRVFIIQGGPGTGKSIVALKLMSSVIYQLKKLAFYVTFTSAPRGVLEKEIEKSVDPNNPEGSSVSELIEFAGNWVRKERNDNELDCVLVDESHRLRTSAQGAIKKGVSITQEIIRSAKVSVFFVDDKQIVTHNDAGSVENIIKECIKVTGKPPIMRDEYNLVSQFRCNGASGYVAFVNHIIYGDPYPNDDLTFGFEPVFCNKSPYDLVLEIKNKQNEGYNARMLAGYCYEYVNHIGDVTPINRPWNSDVKTWASDPNAKDEVGCVFSAQGMEFDYTGVVIGKDMKYRNGNIIFDCDEHSKTDTSYMNKDFKRIPENIAKAKKYIQNAYNVLLTRGMKGCYIYCEDSALGEYLEKEWQDFKKKYSVDI